MIDTKAQEIADYLFRHHQSLSVAESCTGGYLTASLTSVRGASQWMRAGVVAYTEKAKRELLGLTDLELGEGLITKSCAKGMVSSIALMTSSDYAISTTGVCDDEVEGFKPCTAWIGIKTPQTTKAILIDEIDRGRYRNMMRVVNRALQALLYELNDEY